MTVNYVSKGGAAGFTGAIGAAKDTPATANRGLDREGGEVELGLSGMPAYGDTPLELGGGLDVHVGGKDTEKKDKGGEGDEGDEGAWTELGKFDGDDGESKLGDYVEGDGLLSDDELLNELGGDEDEDGELFEMR